MPSGALFRCKHRLKHRNRAPLSTRTLRCTLPLQLSMAGVALLALVALFLPTATFDHFSGRYITPARKFRMLLHINPTRQRGKRTGSLAGASGWYMTFFAAGVIPPSGRQISAASGRRHPLSGTRETWSAPNVHLATVLPQLAIHNYFLRPFPAGYCHPPTAGLGKDRTRPDLDDRPLSLVCHQTGRSVGTNLSVLSSQLNGQPTTDNRQPTTDNRQLRSIQEEPVVPPGDDLRMGRPGKSPGPR